MIGGDGRGRGPLSELFVFMRVVAVVVCMMMIVVGGSYSSEMSSAIELKLLQSTDRNADEHFDMHVNQTAELKTKRNELRRGGGRRR